MGVSRHWHLLMQLQLSWVKRQPWSEALPTSTGAGDGNSAWAQWPCWAGPTKASSRRPQPRGCRAAFPPALGNGSTFSSPGPSRGLQGLRGRPAGARPVVPQPQRGRPGPAPGAAPEGGGAGAGRAAGGGARGVRGRGGVQLSLALLVVTARQAHIPSGSRSLSPFCFPTIELRWKQKIEGV